MLDLLHLTGNNGTSDVQVYVGGSVNGSTDWIVWNKPRGKTMCSILLIGKGGDGGTGAVGAVSTAAGGGGGASGGQTYCVFPLAMLPDNLYMILPSQGSAQSNAFVNVYPSVSTQHQLMIAAAGGNGGNASGATAGAAGTAAAVATAASMQLGWGFCVLALAGQAGIIGGTTVAGGALALPTTGLRVTGGTGGGGLGAAGSAGFAGGNITGAGVFPTVNGGSAPAGATSPPGSGSAGANYAAISYNSLMLLYGGTGGASTNGSATGAGLVQSSGGNGAPGCGGGGSGGALTGSTAGVKGLGGSAMCIITTW